MNSIITNIDNIVKLENYSDSDDVLIQSKEFIRSFGNQDDFIEFHIYSLDGNIISSDYNFKEYKIPGLSPGSSSLTSDIIFTPDVDLQNRGFVNGTFNVQYNVLRNRVSSSNDNFFFINQISADRKELRLISNKISNEDVENGAISLISDIHTSPYYRDFLLDFGNNKFSIGVNLSLDKNTIPYSVLVKLYSPLDTSVGINTPLWIVEELSDSYSFEVELLPDPVEEIIPMLRGPNFDLDLDHLQIPPSQYYNYFQLLGNNSLSSYQQLLNMMNNKGIQLNIDYSDYSNFVHFSSAKQRLLNFYYKVQQLEGYNTQLVTLSSLSSSFAVSNSISIVQNNINNLIKKFDGYENYLYYYSSSNAWPKSGSETPFTLYPSDSVVVRNWIGSDDSFSMYYGGQILSASLYDTENPDYLIHSIPEYVLIDEQNEGYILFVEMIGQHFDSIWVYIKAAGDIYKANNSFTKGISKDLVFYALRSMGIRLYNDHSNQDLYQYLLGQTSSGSFLPSTSSFQTLITAQSQSISGQDRVKEIFKRIYHNVPFILKTKGTDRGLRALSNLYGIPSTVMRFTEFGGMDKLCSTSQYSFDRFSYSLRTDGSGSVVIPWDELSINDFTSQQSSFPDTIEFRFKPDKNTTSLNYTQSLIEIGDGVSDPLFGVQLKYTSSNNIPYGNLRLFVNGSGGLSFSNTISLPIFATGSDGDTYWWNLMLRRRNLSFAIENDLIDFDIQFVIDSDTSNINVGSFDSTGSGDQYYDLFVKNQINGVIGHQGSASIFVSQSMSSSYNSSWNTSAEIYLGGYDHNNTIHPDGVRFFGNFQELRIWSYPIFQSAFNYHVLNPESIQGNDSGSFFNYLAGWFPLGNNLFIYNHALTGSVSSVHPFQKAVFPSASFIRFPNKINYDHDVETYYENVPLAGYSSPITDKVRIQDTSITGSVLSYWIRLEDPLDFPLTKDIHLIEASFSPQNEINEDIIASFGNTFNIDDYIGDPSDYDKNNYPNLDNLISFYYQKYFSKYDFKDYISLIQYFNNSLFKTFNDFIAGRANIETGITIKSTLLERNKIKEYNPQFYFDNFYTASIGSSSISEDSKLITNYGDGVDVYNGEFSGSIVNTHHYFQETNKNIYKLFGNNNTPTFKGSQYDITYGNVILNTTSSIRKKVDVNGKILVTAELQDYYYEYKRNIISKYEGSKSTSKIYNFYSSQSFSGSILIWNGDTSFGKTAAIDNNTLKFGWIKQISAVNLNFFDKTSIILKYLVDVSGSITELSRHNYNLFEVQNTFKSGTPTIVSLSDLINPSNQTTLDGNKNIFEGGFSYWPIVYRETAEQLHFRYLTSLVSTASISLKAIQTSNFQYNTKVGGTGFKNIDDDASQGGYILTYNNNTLTSGQFAFAHIQPFSSWSYANVPGLREVGSVLFTSGSGAGGFNPHVPVTVGIFSDVNQWVYQVNTNFFNLSNNVTTNDSFSEYIKLSDGSYAYKVPRTSVYNFKVDIPFNISLDEEAAGETILKVIAVLEKSTNSSGDGPWTYLDSSKFNYVEGSTFAQYAWTPEKSVALLDFDSYFAGNDFPLKTLCSINSNISLNANDYVRVSFFIIRLANFLPVDGVNFGKISFQNRFSSISVPTNPQAGTMIITDTINQATVVISDGEITDNVIFSISGSNNNILKFSDTSSLLYGNIIFDQSAVSSSTAQLYSDIDFPFTFEEGDIVRLSSYFTNNPTYYRVLQVIPPSIAADGVTVLNSLALVLDKSINVLGSVSANFVIFRRLPDETSVILNFNKLPGETSQALLIPYDIKPEIKSNIANIVTEISPGISALNN